MARTGIVHHTGTFLLFAASILLLITTISAPVVHDIAILKVMLTNSSDIRHSSVTFGTFGHCILDTAPAQTDQDYCYPRTVGYDPTAIMASIDGSGFSTDTAETDSTDALTRVMILHPVVTGLAFIAFLIALGAGFCGSILAAFVAGITFLISLIAMACDFALFVIIRNHVNSDGSGSHAYFSVGMWTILAGTICLFLAFFLVLFSCCSARMHRQRGTTKEAGYVDGVAPVSRRGRFWRSRY
jgi:hypothetical protein